MKLVVCVHRVYLITLLGQVKLKQEDTQIIARDCQLPLLKIVYIT